MPAEVLPDYLELGLRAVFVGTAVATTSARVGGYYAGSGNEFWPNLFDSGLTANRLVPGDERSLLRYGFGLTDLVKNVAQSHDRGLVYDVPAFIRKMEHYRPAWIVSHGKKAAQEVGRHLGHGEKIDFGQQNWTVAGLAVFVLPNSSGSNRDPSRLEGKASRVEWWRELARVLPPLDERSPR